MTPWESRPAQQEFDDLVIALVEFNALDEVQELFKRGVKYVTDEEVQNTISEALELRLQAILDLADKVLVNDRDGKKNTSNWAKLTDAGLAKDIWIRHNANLAKAVISLKSISIAFECRP